jgi:hypothetical protein
MVNGAWAKGVKSKHLYFAEFLFRLPLRFKVISNLEKRTIDVERISTGHSIAGAGDPTTSPTARRGYKYR